MGKTVRLRLSHFLYNAGVRGVWRVLDAKVDHSFFRVEDDELTVNPEAFHGFEEAYVGKLLDDFGDRTRCTMLIQQYDDLAGKDPASDDWDDFCGLLKQTMERASYRSAYEIIKTAGDDEDIESLVSEMGHQKKDLRARREIADRIVSYVRRHKDVLMLKDIAYTCVQPFWAGVAFLHTSKNTVDMVQSYKEFFVDEAMRFISDDDTKRTRQCSECGLPMRSSEGYGLSWLGDLGVDQAKKPSSFWKSNADLSICPICRLVYSCVPLGFSQIGGEGLFINSNSSIDELNGQNNVILSLPDLHNLSEAAAHARMRIARMVTQAELGQSEEFAPHNIQIIRRVRKGNGTDRYEYRSEVLSRDKLAALKGCEGSFNALLRAGMMVKARRAQGGKDIRAHIYDEAVERLFSGSDQYSLIHELLDSSWRDGTRAWPVIHLLRIEAFIKGGGRMDDALMKKVSLMRHKGEEVRDRFIREMGGQSEAENRLRSYAYYLLNALKGRDISRFLDTVMRMYIGIGAPVPSLFAQGIADDELFLQLGYAYVLGLKGEARETPSDDKLDQKVDLSEVGRG